jgi:hypothetical protein
MSTAERMRDKVAIAERAGLIAPEPAPPDPVAPVLHAAHGVKLEEPVAEQLRTLPGEVIAGLARFVNWVWWAGYRTKGRVR